MTHTTHPATANGPVFPDHREVIAADARRFRSLAPHERWAELFAFRLQDQTDIESLVAANRDAIDVEWIKREWQTIFDLEDPRMLWLLGQILRC